MVVIMRTIVLAIFWQYTCTIAEDLVIETPYGSLKGTTEKTFSGLNISVFYSIPYAEPPVGKLRLMPPVEPKPWNGTRDATKPPPMCVQPIGGLEDCLYLNIFTPKLTLNDSTAKLPVMVYIHGGAFKFFSGTMFPGNYLLDKPVVFVNLNYRLGPLGFLGMGTNEFSGNFGLKDQSLALKWVKSNIEAFGGNGDDITLFGHSAGSVSVHLHSFNPLSKGLYQKHIMQSGSAVAAWGVLDKATGRALTSAFLVSTGCYRPYHKRVLECLQNLPAEEFAKAEKGLHSWGTENIWLFKPMVEGENVKGAALLQKPNLNSYQSAKLPAIIGVTSGEAVFRVLDYFSNEGKFVKDINADYRRFIPLTMSLQYRTNPDQLDELADAAKNFYFGEKEIANETDVELVQLLSDAPFVVPAIQTILAYEGPVYAYLYDHKINCLGRRGCYKDEYGVSHADELPLLFKDGTLTPDKMSPAEKRISAQLIDFWTNFAIYGNPNGNKSDQIWAPVTSKQLEYLRIATDDLKMEKELFFQRYKFWEELLKRTEISAYHEISFARFRSGLSVKLK